MNMEYEMGGQKKNQRMSTTIDEWMNVLFRVRLRTKRKKNRDKECVSVNE